MLWGFNCFPPVLVPTEHGHGEQHGHGEDHGQPSCTECEQGRFQPQLKMRNCTSCPSGWSIDNIGCGRCYITGTEGHTIFFESNGCPPEQLIEALAEEAQGYDSSVVFEYVYYDELGEDRGGAAVRKRDL